MANQEEVHDISGDDEAETDPAISSGIGKRKAGIWKTDFTLVPSSVGDGVPTAIYKHCGWSQKAPASASTNNFRKHLSERCKKVPIRDPTQTCITAQGTLANRKIDQEIFKEKLANLTFHHEYSFSFVEHKKFRELLTYLNPEVNHITRNTLKAKVLSVNDREKHKVEASLQNLPAVLLVTCGHQMHRNHIYV